MPRVVLSEEEIFKFHTENPSIPIEYCTGLLQRKGIKFKTTFGTYTEEHILPPWEVFKDRTTGTLYVTQGVK